MKKIIFLTVLVTIMIHTCFSKEIGQRNQQQNSVTELFNNYSKYKNVTHVKLGGLVMLFARAFTDTMGVTGVEVFSFDECDKQVIDELNDAIKNLKDNSYETLVSTTQDGERTKVLVKIKEDFINEIVVISGGSDPALIRITGKIKPEDIQKVIDNN
jgi:7-cyano-7-deazaguanine synthase in queuosine biosynthesis